MSNTWKPFAEGIKNILNGNIDLDSGSFKVALFDSSKTINQDTDSTYNSTNEVANGNGYTTGGKAVTVTLSVNTTTKKVEVRITDPLDWTSSTITARHAEIYLDGATKYLLGFMTFGDASPANISSVNGTFSVDENDANGMIFSFQYA